MIPNLEEIPLPNSDFTVNRLKITSSRDFGGNAKTADIKLGTFTAGPSRTIFCIAYKEKNTTRGRKGPAEIFSNWQHRYLRILTCPLLELGDPWWHFHFWRQPQIIIGPFMERDFIYTPLIILNFPMTDFKTQPIVVPQREEMRIMGYCNCCKK